MRTIRIINVGDRYGKLTIVKELEIGTSSNQTNKRKVLCQCDCGNTLEVVFSSLYGGYTKSCGCYNKETIGSLNKTHGGYDEPLYKVYHKHLIKYGHEIFNFDNYEAFRSWSMDNRYGENMVLTRTDKKRPYIPNNATYTNKKDKINLKYRSSNVIVNYNGEEISLIDLCERHNLHLKTIRTRLNRGMSINDAITKPIIKRK